MTFVGFQSPWSYATIAVLALALATDAVLGKRYAGGSAERDQKTAPMLVISLGANMILQLVLPAFDIGTYTPEQMRVFGPLGFAGTALGLGMRYGAIFSLGRLFTWQVSIVDAHSLYCRGVFRYIRHPSYAGGLFAMLGSSLSLGSWPPLLFMLFTHVPVTVYRIVVEERLLAEHFGEQYRDYKGRTRRLLPFVY